MIYLRFRFPALYRFAAYMALLAMLVPLGTILVHHPEAAQAPVHICNMDMHYEGDQGKAPAHKTPSCPICQGLQLLSGGFVPPAIVGVAPVAFAAAIYIFTERIFPSRPLFAPQARPRAPPELV